jgi:plasmid stabilization system protein ParE
MPELSFRPEAEAEAAEARAWYESKRAGLGDEFLLALDAAIESILRNPLQHPVARTTVRRAVMRRFPYALFFVVEGDRVTVLAVFHGRRSPRRWQRRV